MDESPPYRQQAIELLTRLLVEAEEGRMQTLVTVYQDEAGTWQTRFTGCDSRSVVGAQLMRVALERLGFVTQADLGDFVRRDEL